ncbi:SDR family NAD(P)-dependent oxidoreductase [Nocardioides sp.]|uniref:SDR family NAD(P)-dependent oxidoreductase n=1 Tax=Nocardioides sp. TaxID=35761 RepID=UPI00260D88F3|nr:SDR family NAD(P)-dependent oxidoreductase [Nocardioides sp.]
MTTIAVLGATSGIAQACLRQWTAQTGQARQPLALRLVARDAQRLERTGADLSARGAAVTVTPISADLSDATSVSAAVDAIFADGPVDIVMIAFGTMPSQAEADASAQVGADLLHVNGTLALLAAHLVALRLEGQGHGALAVLGSVAGDRGRQSNYLYGAAKAMVATGVAGLQHRLASSPVTVTLVKPGPTATPMTDHLRGGKLALADVDAVAAEIVAGVEAGRPVVYAPRRWRLIMAIIRAVPRRIFERTSL